MAPKAVSKALTPESQLRTYIDQLDPKQQRLFKSIRAAVRKRFPTANELAYDYGDALVVSYAPADKGIDGILAIRASNAGVSLYFNQGPQLPDPQRLLQGSGKQVRFIQLESTRQLALPEVEALIAAAVEQARIPFPSEGKGNLIIKSDRAKKTPRRKQQRGHK